MSRLTKLVGDTLAENAAAGVEMEHGPGFGAGNHDPNDGNIDVRPGQIEGDGFVKSPIAQALQQEADVGVDRVVTVGRDILNSMS